LTLDKPLPQIGGKGLFTQELENALHAGRIDLAVHSLKDLPIDSARGITLGAIMGRADVRDVLVTTAIQGVGGNTLGSLPFGAHVGTSSMRRHGQLKVVRPDLNVQSIRGNVETRIRKVKEGLYDATILAAAGVTRLELEHYVAQWLPLDVMLPAPGQGALAVQCRAEDEPTLALLAKIHQAEVAMAVKAERSFLNHLGGGCATPVAAYAQRKGNHFFLQGLVTALDGSRQVKVEGHGADGWELGVRLAEKALDDGAREILGHG
ncbi:MAG: hydroxymethylbilane synthase, partial [Candidatus Promineifilaceae bacterium]|nr:hydroxymethylbilane synthase [Candidatus Promineifilaceae bacterium]